VDITAPLLLDIGLVLLLAAAAGWLARRLGLPAVVGYLAVGLAVSPFTPGYVADRGQLRLLADIGVVLLLFEVGIELDLLRIRREQRALLVVAPAQMLITTTVAGGALAMVGIGPFGAALVGLAVAYSSTVVVVNITRSRWRTTDPPTEQAMLGWAVLQDVTGVVLALVILAAGGWSERPLGIALAGFAAYVTLAAAVAWLLPRVLRQLREEPDLFLVVSVASGLAVAAVGGVVFGVPVGLAAFIGGLAISEGPDTAEARRRIGPFRDVFAVAFFVSLGTLVDPAAVAGGAGYVALLLALLVGAKSALAWVLARLIRLPASPLHLAVGLGQVGEFSFVLVTAALAADAIPADLYAAVLTTLIVSVAGSTILARALPRATAGGGPARLRPETG